MACFADTSQTYVALGRNNPDESVRDTLPSQVTKLRFTSSSLQFNAESTQSEEIRADRNVSDVIRTSASSSGDIGFELSYGQQTKEILQAALMTEDAHTGPMVNGTKKYYHSIIDRVKSASSEEFTQYDNMEFDTYTLSMEQGSIVTGSTTILGGNVSTASGTSPITVVDNPDTDKRVYNAVKMITGITEGGAAAGDIQSLEFSFNNQKREQRAIGHEFPVCTGDGTFEATGSLTAYFSSNELYQKFIDDEESSIAVVLDDKGDGTGNKIAINLPRVVYSEASREIPGNNQDLLVSMSFTALFDATLGGAVEVTFTDAA